MHEREAVRTSGAGQREIVAVALRDMEQLSAVALCRIHIGIVSLVVSDVRHIAVPFCGGSHICHRNLWASW
jgi:hypothetical protein